MIKRILSYSTVLAALALGFACNEPIDTQNKALVLNPDTVRVGQTLCISYDNAQTELAGKENIEGVYYYWQNWHWVANDLNLEKVRGLWKASVEVPEDAGLIAFKFMADGVEDCGGAMWSYVTFTSDSLGYNLPSSYVGWGMLRNGLFKDEYGIPGYVNDSTLIGDDVMLYWCNIELKYHPQIGPDVLYYAAKAVKALGKTESFETVRKGVENIIPLDTILHDEAYLVRGIEIANKVLQDQELAKQLEDYALDSYPNGILARDKEIWRIFRISDTQEKAAAQAEFVKKYPYKDWKDIDTENSMMYLGKNFQSVVYMPIIQHNDYSLLYNYLHELPYDYLYTFFWQMVQNTYRNKQVSAEKLLPIGQALIDEAFDRPQTQKQQVYSPKEWKEYLYNYRKESLLDWSMILDETGSTDKALEWMKILEPIYNGKVEKFSNFYMALLQKSGLQDKALEVARLGVENNAASPEMLEVLKNAYVQEQGSDQGFEMYIHDLKKIELSEEQKAEIKTSFVNEPIALFELETIDGQTINMADYKGKIIVLDFWATWCAPCKSAMPGMNMAVQKYKEDDDVVFFFISTMEIHKDFKEKIQAFITEKGYSDFNVLLDVDNPESHKRDYVYSNYAKTFHFSGIPQKLIIGPEGNLRWRATGFNGSSTALVDEISYIIETLKQGS